MPVALVTGAAGAIGRHCVGQLRERGWTVGGVGHGDPQWKDGEIDHWLAGPVTAENLDRVGERIGTPELIVHLASGSSVGASLTAPLDDFDRIVMTGVRMMDWVWKNAPQARLSLASSAAVYGNAYLGPIDEAASPAPLSPYGHHKLMMEQNARFWGRSFGIRSAIVRLFSVYGPGLRKQLVYDLCSKLADAPEEIVLGGTGTETRDWLWIGDAARMMIEAGALASTEAPVLNACTGHAAPVDEVAGRLAALWGGRTSIRYNGNVRPGDPVHMNGATGLLAEAGISAEVMLDEGLERTVNFWRQAPA